MFLSVVLSFYNEEEVLPELIGRLRDVLRPLCGTEYELLFVDDDSKDGSAAILAEASKEGDVKVITMARNAGPSVCAVLGIRHARGDAVIYMDSDLQDPPELIPRLVEAWRAGADVVHTVRTSRKGENAPRRLVIALGYAILNHFSSVEIIPDAGDFKLLSRRVVDEIRKTDERRPFPRGLSTWVGFPQVRIPYEREVRASGKSKCPFLGKRVVDYFLDTAFVSFSDRPLKTVFLLGLAATSAGFLLLLGLAASRLAGLSLPHGSGLLCAVVLLGGIQLASVGLLGLYVNAIHAEVRRRPPYVIREKSGF